MIERQPEILIFDVDGVLVDVTGSFHRSVVDTIRHFTGRRVTSAEVHHWKNKPGYNDDWKLTTDWVNELGCSVSFAEVKRKFEQFYWGRNGDGNVHRERWLVPRVRLRRWASRAELALFTGRTRRELRHTLRRAGVQRYFRRIVTMNDVTRAKPDPEGLLRILDGRDPATAIYVGDNVDDALAAQSSGVPFLGVLPHNSTARRLRGTSLRRLGARAILGSVNELDRWLR